MPQCKNDFRTKEIDNGKPYESGNLLQHIDDAKAWLEKAKTEYKQANPLQGELILNLAQAEVKYAWELSRKRCVANEVSNRRRPRLKLLLPLAASFVLVMGVCLWQFSQVSNHGGTLTARNSKSAITSETKLPEKASRKVTSAAPGTPAPVLPNTSLAEVAATGDDAKGASVTAEPARTVTPAAGSNSVRQPNTVAETRNQPPGTTNQVQANLQPVTEFSIDEEALTKEASRSLRSGK